MNKGYRFVIAALVLGLTAARAQDLKIVHFDIGQGDATLIWSPSGQTMLVDAGPSMEPDVIRNYLLAQGISDLTYTLATHYHSDHIGEYPDLFNSGYLPNVAYDRGDNPGYGTSIYTAYVNAAFSVRQTINPGQVIDLGGGVTAKAVCVNGHLMNGATYTLSDENERSIALLVEYRNFRYMVSGDLGGGNLSLFDLETPVSALVGDINVFQMNHHGSNSSTNNNWLNNLDAEAAVVSLANNNSYGHVHAEVISRITANPTIQALYHTEQGFNVSSKSVVVNGHVLLQTDGMVFYTVAGDSFNLGDFWVELTPLGPTTIPPGGGTLNYNIAGGNDGIISWAVDVWADLTLPNGSTSGPVLGPINNFNMPAGFSTDRNRTLTVAGSSPAGNYTLNAYLGNYSPPNSVVYAIDQLPFTKSGMSPYQGDESNWFMDSGEPFEMAPNPSIPTEVGLIRSHPNPFNPTTAISFKLPAASYVRLSVYDNSGRLVSELVNGWREAGEQQAVFDGTNLTSGMYICRLLMGDETATGKMVLIK